MNTLLKAIVLSISTALVAAPVMAAPHEYQADKSHTQQNHNASKHQQQIQKNHQHKLVTEKSVNPSRDWRAGQKIPAQYYTHADKVDHKQYKKLSKPSKNQQWIKINGDYVLTNVINHKIIKIIGG